MTMATHANAMTVDIEDYFQVQAFEGHIERASWDRLAPRVERNTEAVLALFAESGARATFFTLGWVAERYPALIRRIVAEGHELASHGYAHTRATDQDRDGFRDDVRRTRTLLEDTAGVPVTGYRAASFSIGANNLWTLEVLRDEGYLYSSSIYPVRHDHYGMPEAPRFAWHPCGAEGVIEFPVTTVRLLGRNLPCGGGGYFRLLPYPLSRWAMRRVNRHDDAPCIFYFHPWEIDPGQPRQPGLPLKTRARHYVNLRRMEGKLRAALRDFTWDRMDRVFAVGAEP
ncbi:MAG: XrtA system polysaccharide deacetylase [Alphaproteobacteria bacterium]